MKYKVDIQGMHCTGCANLISMNLDEQNLKEVSVDQSTNVATFEGGDQAQVEESLKNAFADIPEYSYSNLIITD